MKTYESNDNSLAQEYKSYQILVDSVMKSQEKFSLSSTDLRVSKSLKVAVKVAIRAFTQNPLNFIKDYFVKSFGIFYRKAKKQSKGRIHGITWIKWVTLFFSRKKSSQGNFQVSFGDI